MWRVLEVTHTRTLHTLTLKQPNSEIENKCDKRDTERWKREGGRKEGRGIRERAADVKIVWREIRKHARKQNQKRKKGKLYWNINQQYLLFCFILHVWQINECVCACGCVFVHVCWKLAFFPQSLWVDCIALSSSNALLWFFRPDYQSAQFHTYCNNLTDVLFVQLDASVLLLWQLCFSFFYSLIQHVNWSPSSAEQVESISLRDFHLPSRPLLSHELCYVHSAIEALNLLHLS